MLELANVLPPFVRQLVGGSLPIAVSFLMAPLPRALSFDVVVLLLALQLVEARCRVHP